MTISLTFSRDRYRPLELVFQRAVTPNSPAIRVWSGAQWSERPIYRWNGASFEPATVKRWSGTAWV